ncbi:ABC transporter permease [Streptomyces sp. NPDC096311]|uniref:ABC transporter permease n=1 Tax=Streptomyces sp. NPDC096311 TaxID=3366083 RepID=UPI0038115DEA
MTVSDISTTARSTTERPHPGYRVTGPRVLHSEWMKFWTLRSSWITLSVAMVILIAFGFIATAVYDPATAANAPGPRSQQPTDGVGLALAGATLAQLAIGVLGVLVSAGEYSTGMIRATLAAVPRRLPVLWAKALNYGAIAFVLSAVAVVVAFLLGMTQLTGTSMELSLSHAGVLRSLAGGAVYLALVGVLGVALGSVLRSVAGGIAVLVAAMLVIPGLTLLLPDSWENHITPYLPSNAGNAMMSLVQHSDQLSPGAGFAVLAGWTLAALAGAAVRLVRKDA